MNKDAISTLIHFNFWANGRILTTCKQLTPDQFTQTVTPDPGWGSLRGILVHTLDTEFGWRSVLQAQNADTILNETDFTDVAALSARWDIEKVAWFDYLTQLSDENLNQGYGQESQTGPKVWQTIMHVILHGNQHRAEAAAILTGYGHSPGELDFDIFLQEHSEKPDKFS